MDWYIEEREPHVRNPVALRNSCAVIKKGLGQIYYSDLNKSDIKKYAKKLHDKYSNSSIIRHLACLRAAIYSAKEEGKIKEAFEFRMPISPSPARKRWLTENEALKLLEACKKGGVHVHTFALLALYTGARTEAILELTWDRVNFKKKTIDFGEGYGNKRRAIVPLDSNGELYKHLLFIKEYSISEYVVEYAGRQIQWIKNAFKRAVIAAGIKHASPHSLRHTAVSWMVMRRVPDKEIALYTGMSVEMVREVYGKHSPDFLKGAAKALQTINKRIKKAA